MKDVIIEGENLKLPGLLSIPEASTKLVIFAHGSGSSRLSPRNRFVAKNLARKGIATLLFDLLTDEETSNRDNVFDIDLLAERLKMATAWAQHQSQLEGLVIGYFGASTGAAAALVAAADLGKPIAAIVSRGGRPDLAMSRLPEVSAATLLLVGGKDHGVIELNMEAADRLNNCEVIIIPGASHLFEEEGTLEQVCDHAASWFIKYLNTGKRV